MASTPGNAGIMLRGLLILSRLMRESHASSPLLRRPRSSPGPVDAYRRNSLWLDQLGEDLSPREPLSSRRIADVAIIGGGFGGLWTAYYLKRHAPTLDIVVLESEIAGFGASGRNGGWASAYLAGIHKIMADPCRRAGAMRLQRLMVDTLSEIDCVTAAEGIDCGFQQAGHVSAAVVPAQRGRLQAQVEEMRELGFTKDECHMLDAAALERHIRIDRALAGYYMAHCAAVDPARLVRGLATAVEGRGVSIYEHSPATAIGPGTVHTPHGSVCADRILFATEGYSGSLPQMRRKLIPIHSLMVATRPLTGAERQQVGLERRMTFNNARHLVTYGQITAEGRIAFGCRGHYFYDGRLLDRFDPNDAAFAVVRRELLSFFPHLEGIEFTHAWGGAMGVSRQLEPMVCFDRQAGLGWTGGYFGDGVTAAALAGRTLADLVLGRDTERTHTPWVNPEPFSRFDRGLWESEPLRWLGIRLRANWMRWTDGAEYRGSAVAPAMNWALEHVFP